MKTKTKITDKQIKSLGFKRLVAISQGADKRIYATKAQKAAIRREARRCGMDWRGLCIGAF